MKLPSTWELPEAITCRFGKRTAGKQRAMYEEGHLLLIIHRLPDRKTGESDAVFFWRQPNGEWQYNGRGPGLKSLATHIEAIDQIEEDLKKDYRDAKDSGDYFQILEKLSQVRMLTRGLHVTLQTAREAVEEDRDVIGLRDLAGELDRSFQLLYEDAKNGLDFAMAQQAEEEARLSKLSLRAGHRLNVLAAIFFPLAAISGIFGMNVTVPLQSGKDGSLVPFAAILVVGVVLGIAIKSWMLAEPKKGK